MTKILNVPMPADEAIKIIRSMFDSNRMMSIDIEFRRERWTVQNDCIALDNISRCPLITNPRTVKEVTINSIAPIIPTYSVWDEVMILATGEIGEIIRQDRQYARDCYIAFPDEKIWHRWENYHRSEICKIA